MPTRTDDDGDILAHYRVRYPYISLKQAKGLDRCEAQFGHLGRAKEQRERQAADQAQRELREQLFGVRAGESTAPHVSEARGVDQQKS